MGDNTARGEGAGTISKNGARDSSMAGRGAGGRGKGDDEDADPVKSLRDNGAGDETAGTGGSMGVEISAARGVSNFCTMTCGSDFGRAGIGGLPAVRQKESPTPSTPMTAKGVIQRSILSFYTFGAHTSKLL